MARKKHEKAAGDDPQAVTGVVLEPNETAPVFYVNYMEIGNTANDFTIFGFHRPLAYVATNCLVISKYSELSLKKPSRYGYSATARAIRLRLLQLLG